MCGRFITYPHFNSFIYYFTACQCIVSVSQMSSSIMLDILGWMDWKATEDLFFCSF